jgi:hypothetical protein
VPSPAPVQAPIAPPPPAGNSINGTPIPPLPPAPAVAPPPGDGAVPATPSAFGGDESQPGPSVAVAHYDPRTGEYLSPDGQLQKQTNLAAGGAPKSWKDLMPT